MEPAEQKPEMNENKCVIVRGFYPSPNGEDFALMMTMFDKGYRELYYSAPYHWGLINPKTKKIFTYTEGDTCDIVCPSHDVMIKEAEEYLQFMKKNFPKSPVVWTDGELFIEELKQRSGANGSGV